jgi:hypothetical protein
MQASKILVARQSLELADIEPEIRLGIELHSLGVTEQVARLRETASDVPQGCGERTAGLAFGAVPPEEAGQPFPGLGLLAMEKQIGQEGLGFESRWLGQWLFIIADVQRAQ